MCSIVNTLGHSLLRISVTVGAMVCMYMYVYVHMYVPYVHLHRYIHCIYKYYTAL